tara:strand:+ start:1218 stop:1430 length:213 start_codon:yes stop_codon:yes gene_type:complete
MEYTREQVVNIIITHLNIRLSLNKLYENYTEGKYHKKIIEYNKNRGVLHYRNPWSLYFDDEPLPEFIVPE